MNAIIIIPTLGGESLENCYNALDKYSPDIDTLEVRDGSSWAEAVNIGIQKIREEYPDKDIILMDDDVEVTDGWLNHLEEAKKNYDIIGWSLRKPDGSMQYTGCFLHKIPSGIYLMDNYREPHDYIMHTINCSTSCVYIKKEVFDKIGLFDHETYKHGLHYEDTDFNMRATKAGLLICALPEIVEHREFFTKKDFENAKARVAHNSRIFYTKLNNDKEYLRIINERVYKRDENENIRIDAE